MPRAIVAVVLFVGLKRFGTGLGYLARYWTAETVGNFLGGLGFVTFHSHEVLLLENRIAQVDLPCAGLKSLWTALLFLVAGNFLRRGRFGARFWVVAIAMEGAVLLGNTTRVAILVLLAAVAQRPDGAAAAHVPLGLLFFSMACIGAYFALMACDPVRTAPGTPRSTRKPTWWPWLWAGLALALGLLAARQQSNAHVPALPELPYLVNRQVVALTAQEQRFFAGQPARIGKWHGELTTASGNQPIDVLVVSTASWRAHHAPELCLLAAGYQVEQLATREPSGLFPLRHLQLGAGGSQAVYFFQSRRGTTPDLTDRLFNGWWRGDDEWVLVSLILPRDLSLEDPAFLDFLRAIRAANERNFDLKEVQP